MKPTVTASELRRWTECPQRWWYEYRAGEKENGIVPVEPYMPYIEGRLVHHVLEIYRRTGQMRKADFAKWCEKEVASYLNLRPEHESKMRIRMAAAYGAALGYRLRYPDDPKLNWLGIEKTFQFDFGGIVFQGRVDGYYVNEHDQIILRESKFIDERYAAGLLALPIDTQRWIYVMAIRALEGKWPHGVEQDYTYKSLLRQKKDESYEAFIDRVQTSYTEKATEKYYRHWTQLESTLIEEVVNTHIVPRVHIMQARKPWMNDRSCVSLGGGTCPFLPACIATLERKDGWRAPQCAGLYIEKKARHPEL